MRSGIVLLCLAAAGCSNSISDLREAAPEWYEARKQELQGEGYPDLGTVPADNTYRPRQAGLVKSAAEREAIRQAFFADPRSAPVTMQPAEIMRWSARIREQVSAYDTQASFLTDEDIARLRALFERPRARR